MVRQLPQPLTPLLSLCEGDLLGGRYRIEALVRTRATGVHFEATDLSSGTRVSIHVLVASPGKADLDATRTWFLAGAERAKTLKGPHVARVLDAGVMFEGHPWIVREHLASTTLAAHLKTQGAVAPSDAIEVALAVCDAVAEAHEHGIVHGSLSAHSVHVAWSASGLVDVKVVGAGTSAAEKALSLGAVGEEECILRAPEQIKNGASVDARSDVWAIGVLLHTLLSGKPPFAADTPSGASLSVVIDEPPRLENVPAELAALVLRSIAKDPDRRPQTVLDLAEAIVMFATHPDFYRERIAARRAALQTMSQKTDAVSTLELPKPMRSVPSIIVPPEELIEPSPSSYKQSSKQSSRPPPMAMSADATVLIPRKSRRRAFARIAGAIVIGASLAGLVLVGTGGSGRLKSLMSGTAKAQSMAAPPPPSPLPTVVHAEPPPPVVIAPPPPTAAIESKPEPPKEPPKKRKRRAAN